MISKTGGHVYNVDDIAPGRSREVDIARMRPYAYASFNIIGELEEVLNYLKSQGGLNMEMIKAPVELTTDSKEYVFKAKWVGFY